MRSLAAWVLFVSLATSASAQQFVAGVYKDETGEHKYQVFVPAGYRAGQPVPAILFLHGAGERGTDNQKQIQVGLGPYVKARGSNFPFLAVFPQAEDKQSPLLTPWTAGQPDAERALKILDQVQQQYSIDPKRISLVGWSMGGYGAWSLGAAHPDKWAAVVALSGGGDPATAVNLKDVPVWAFHGSRDQVVPPSASQAMVEALKAAGGNVTYNEFPNAGHTIFGETFGNDGFVTWLEAPKTNPAELSKTSRPLTIEAPPFVPALEIPDAVGIRLGNEALNALSYAAPSLVPSNMLVGRLNDMFDSTSAQGRSFSVRFSGISYAGQLERVQFQALGPDRLNVQLGLSNVGLYIGGTSVTGARQSAYAGPIQISIGYNGPVWLSIDVTPYVENRQLRLRLIGSSFSIPPNNYSVSSPAGVSVRGFGMTEQRVVDGLVSGLYGARYRVENEVRAIVPNIVRELENQLRLADPAPVVSGMWPLPVYQPQLRAYPTAVTTDAEGVSIVMSVVAAAVEPTAKPQLKMAPSAGVSLAELKGKSLGVTIAPEVMSPLSQLLIDADMARVHLVDLPEPGFHRLGDRAVLEEILPDMKRFGEKLNIRSELVFAAPLQVQPDGTESKDSVPLKLALPKAVIEISVQPEGTGTPWQPYANFPLDIQEQMLATLEKPSHARRLLELAWGSEGKITGTGAFAEGANPTDPTVDSAKLVALFEESWRNWTKAGTVEGTPVPDVEFARTKLRMQHLTSTSGLLSGSFEIPTIKLTNLSEEPFVYETRGPYSPWSSPLTLKPGDSHEFQIPYPLTYRHSGGTGTEVYTLYTGTHSEYRVPNNGGNPRLFTAREPQPANP